MDPIAVDLGIIQIYWYSIFIFTAVFVGGLLAIREAKKFDIDENFVTNLLLLGLLIGIVGARLYYVIFNWEYYSNNLVDIVKIWEGGLAIHGGIIAGFVFCIFYCKKNAVKPFRMLDIAAISFLISQAIGRWGNFFNQEAHGPEVAKETLQSYKIPNFIIEGMKEFGVYYHPTFLYESIWNLIGFIILIIYRKFKYVKIGELTLIYLMWYSIGRYFIESLRTDSLMIGDYKMAQIISIVLFVGSFIGMIFIKKRSRLNNLYNGSEEVEEYNI